MPKLIPPLSTCLSSNMTTGEEYVAKTLMHHLQDDSWIWYNPSIPPENLEPDFIILDPGRGLLILEIKDWKLESIGQATSNSVTLLTPDGTSETKNPFKQVKGYGNAVGQRLQKMSNLLHTQSGSLQGKLILPYALGVIFSNITRSELETKDLVEIFGSRSVFCKDDIIKNVDSESFRQRLWSPRCFQLQSRLTDKQINSICHILGLSKPLLKQVSEIDSQSKSHELIEENITQAVSLERQAYQLSSRPDEQAEQPDSSNLSLRDSTQTICLESQLVSTPFELDEQGNRNNEVIQITSLQVPFSKLQSEPANYSQSETNQLLEKNEFQVKSLKPVFEIAFEPTNQDSQSETNKLLETDVLQTKSLEPVSEIANDQVISQSPVSPPNLYSATPASNRSRLSSIPIWMKVGSTVLAVCVVSIIGLRVAPYFQKPKLQASSLTIGTLGSPEYQADLADYLKDQLVPADFGQFLQGKRVRVVIDGDKTLPYQEAERRIASLEWDIAFTLSPVISVAAKDNGYTFAAKMFPNSKSYQSALFVRADSSIKSIDDLKPTTAIALGGFNSASSFYMPAYDLYGKSLTADIGHRGPEVLEMVKTGRADVGAAAVGDTVKPDDRSIRIIHQSRELPSSGVYLSSKLSELDRQSIQKVLLGAPWDLQKKSNYGAGEEPNYSFFREIITKAENIQICSDFTKKPVNFFCTDKYQPITLSGKVNGWSRKADADILNVRESSGKNYRIALPPQLLAGAIGNSDPLAIQGKEIQVTTGNIPQQLTDGTFELKLTGARQLRVLATATKTDIK